MKYEVIEADGEWIVRGDGGELARFAQQNDALADVAARMRDADPDDDLVSLRVSYQSKGG